MSLLWAGYVNMHISIGWQRTKGRGVPRQNRQVAPVCLQTAAAVRTVAAFQCSLKFPQRSLEPYLRVAHAYLRSLTRGSLFNQRSVKVVPFPRRREDGFGGSGVRYDEHRRLVRLRGETQRLLEQLEPTVSGSAFR